MASTFYVIEDNTWGISSTDKSILNQIITRSCNTTGQCNILESNSPKAKILALRKSAQRQLGGIWGSMVLKITSPSDSRSIPAHKFYEAEHEGLRWIFFQIRE